MNHIPDAREGLTTKNDSGTSFFFVAEDATTSSIPFSGKVIEFDSKMKLSEAMHSLANNGVLVGGVVRLGCLHTNMIKVGSSLGRDQPKVPRVRGCVRPDESCCGSRHTYASVTW